MKKSKSILGICTLSAAVALTGCQNIGSSSSSLSKGDEVEFFSSSGWGACAVGAAGGAVLGGLTALVSGADAKTAAIAGVGAAVVGCGAAMGADYYLEKQRKAYARKEDRLKSYIDEVRKNSQMVERATSKVRGQLARNNQTMKTLERQLRAGQIQKADAQKQLAQIDADLKVAQSTLEGMRKREQVLRDVAHKERASGLKVGRLEAEISSLNKKIAAYERIVSSSSKQRSAIQVG